MRCDEIQERFVDLLYQEPGTPPASPELRAHLASCPACRRHLEQLNATRAALATWQDESPLRPVVLPEPEPSRSLSSWVPAIRFLRVGALAALAILAFLALANAELTWNKDGFAFRTHLFRRAAPVADYYTKAESRELLKSVLDDTERRVMETNYLMMQRMMDTIEQDRWQELRLVRRRLDQTQDKN